MAFIDSGGGCPKVSTSAPASIKHIDHGDEGGDGIVRWIGTT